MDAIFASSSGTKCHLPRAKVLQPRSLNTAGIMAFSKGMRPLLPGKPAVTSSIQDIPLLVALRPFNRDERVGEQRAVV